MNLFFMYILDAMAYQGLFYCMHMQTQAKMSLSKVCRQALLFSIIYIMLFEQDAKAFKSELSSNADSQKNECELDKLL